MMTNHLGRCLRQFSAKLRPVTLPSRIHKVWRKMAKRLDIRTIKRCANLVAAPAKAGGQQPVSTSQLGGLGEKTACQLEMTTLTIHIGGIVARIYVCHSDQEARSDEARILGQDF